MMFWEQGQKTAFAKAAKISPSQLSDYLAHRKTPSPETARKLVKVSMRICREVIPLTSWLFEDERHPAFKYPKRSECK